MIFKKFYFNENFIKMEKLKFKIYQKTIQLRINLLKYSSYLEYRF